MTDERSLERAARSWIEAGPTQAPDRAVEAALLRIQSTQQERDLRIPWRLPTMLTNRAAVSALATVLVIAGGGIVLSRLPGAGSGVPLPTPIPKPTPSSADSAPSASSTAAHALSGPDIGRALPPGVYRVDAFPAPFTLRLPAGWTVSQMGPDNISFQSRADGKVNIALMVLVSVYANPCHPEASPAQLRPGVENLLGALSSVRKFKVENVKAVTVGGAQGNVFEFSNAIDTTADGCASNPMPFGERERGLHGAEMFGGESDIFWALDANRTSVLIAVTNTPSIVAATKPIVESILFERGASN